ncbi:tail assembly chaperone [Erwinia phage Snitter]|nr:tail assembly chaperone [Erwinia phage Snitter]
MSKFKLTLGRLPDFKLPVKFIMPNGDEAKLTFTVKHMKAEEVQKLYDGEVKDNVFMKSIATGWDLEEEFNDANVEELIALYPSATIALTATYISALAGQRVKN